MPKYMQICVEAQRFASMCSGDFWRIAIPSCYWNVFEIWNLELWIPQNAFDQTATSFMALLSHVLTDVAFYKLTCKPSSLKTEQFYPANIVDTICPFPLARGKEKHPRLVYCHMFQLMLLFTNLHKLFFGIGFLIKLTFQHLEIHSSEPYWYWL